MNIEVLFFFISTWSFSISAGMRIPCEKFASSFEICRNSNSSVSIGKFNPRGNIIREWTIRQISSSEDSDFGQLMDEANEAIRESISKTENLSTLEISDINLEQVNVNTFSKSYPSLVDLNLVRNRIGSIEPKSFAPFKNLRSLKLDSNKLRNLEPEIFSGLDQLQVLLLTSNNLTFIPKNVFNGLRKLSILNLADNRICEIEGGSFSGLSVKKLSLKNNKITSIKAGVFGKLEAEILDLSDNMIDGIEKDAFKDSKIKELYLMNNRNMTIDRIACGLPESTRIFPLGIKIKAN